MTKEEIIKIFLNEKIIVKSHNKYKRKFNWRTNFKDNLCLIFNDFKKQYRSDDEAWFCLCNDVEPEICPICKCRKVKFTGSTKNGKNGYNLTCDVCSANRLPSKILKAKCTVFNFSDDRKKDILNKRKLTNKKRYGTETYMCFGTKEFKNNLKLKYNDEHYNNREKAKQTCLNKYGVISNLLINSTLVKARINAWNSNTRAKRINNSINLYGCMYPCQNKLIIDKIQQSKQQHIKNLEEKYNGCHESQINKKYGQGWKSLNLNTFKIPEYESLTFIKLEDEELIKKYFNEGSHTNGYFSKKEKDLLEYIKSIYSGIIKENDTSVVRNCNYRFYELDIYLPEIKLGIDFNGIYWHSSIFKDKYYHQRKTLFCRLAGIRMIHVFEDEWDNNKDHIKDVLFKIINNNFENVINKNDDVYIGDNKYPIDDKAEIISISEPNKVCINKLSYYDCGKIFYKRGKNG